MHSILDNLLYSLSFFRDLTRPDELEGRRGSYGVFLSLFFADFYHIYHATKMGSAGSRDFTRGGRSHAFFLSYSYHLLCIFVLTLFYISFPPLLPTFLFAVYKPRKELWRSKGVYMLCFFVLSPTGAASFIVACVVSSLGSFQTRKRKTGYVDFCLYGVKCTLFGLDFSTSVSRSWFQVSFAFES